MRHHRTAHVDSAQEALLTLGRLVDQALERIRIQRTRVELAEALQRHLLPPQLPQLRHRGPLNPCATPSGSTSVG